MERGRQCTGAQTSGVACVDEHSFRCTRAPARRILHLACHGLTDQSHGNLFGALALARGENAAEDPGEPVDVLSTTAPLTAGTASM